MRLVQGRECAVEGKCEIVQDSGGRKFILLSAGYWSWDNLVGVPYRAIVGHHGEDAIVDGSGFPLQLGLALDFARFVFNAWVRRAVWLLRCLLVGGRRGRFLLLPGNWWCQVQAQKNNWEKQPCFFGLQRSILSIDPSTPQTTEFWRQSAACHAHGLIRCFQCIVGHTRSQRREVILKLHNERVLARDSADRRRKLETDN